MTFTGMKKQDEKEKVTSTIIKHTGNNKCQSVLSREKHHDGLCTISRSLE